jgi:succinyl-CoA synthetase beta subunit
MPKGDREALAKAVSAFSQIAFIDGVTEAEINPLIVKREGEGVIAVDGLIVRKSLRDPLTGR